MRSSIVVGVPSSQYQTSVIVSSYSKSVAVVSTAVWGSGTKLNKADFPWRNACLLTSAGVVVLGVGDRPAPTPLPSQSVVATGASREDDAAATSVTKASSTRSAAGAEVTEL